MLAGHREQEAGASAASPPTPHSAVAVVGCQKQQEKKKRRRRRSAAELLTPKDELPRGARSRRASASLDFGSPGGRGGLRHAVLPSPRPSTAVVYGPLQLSCVVNAVQLTDVITRTFACPSCSVLGGLEPDEPERHRGGQGLIVKLRCALCVHKLRLNFSSRVALPQAAVTPAEAMVPERMEPAGDIDGKVDMDDEEDVKRVNKKSLSTEALRAVAGCLIGGITHAGCNHTINVRARGTITSAVNSLLPMWLEEWSGCGCVCGVRLKRMLWPGSLGAPSWRPWWSMAQWGGGVSTSEGGTPGRCIFRSRPSEA
mgnify:CR=1 FL=1